MNRGKITWILQCASGVLLLSTVLFAQSTRQTDQTRAPQSDHKTMTHSATKTAAQDRQFMMKAAEGGQMEVMMGQLGVSKATNPDVKQFAQRMVDDHSKANEELKSLAAGKGVTLPPETDAKHTKMKNKFDKLSGATFDREYMKHMVADHRKDISLFEQEARSGRDADVKAWADKTLPTLREHYQQALDAAKKAGGNQAAATDHSENKGRKGSTSATNTKPRP